MTEHALELVKTEGLGLYTKYKDMLGSLSEIEKEYVLKLSILKTIDYSKMSAKELIEAGELNLKISELGLDISEELDSFWSAFNDVVTSILDKATDLAVDVGRKTIATSVLGPLGVLI